MCRISVSFCSFSWADRMWSCGHTNGSQELNLRMMLLDIHWIYLRSKPTLVVGVVGWAICACHNILSFIQKKKKIRCGAVWMLFWWLGWRRQQVAISVDLYGRLWVDQGSDLWCYVLYVVLMSDSLCFALSLLLLLLFLLHVLSPDVTPSGWLCSKHPLTVLCSSPSSPSSSFGFFLLPMGPWSTSRLCLVCNL